MYKELFNDPQNATEKIYVNGQLHPDVRVGMRQVNLTNGERVGIAFPSVAYD